MGGTRRLTDELNGYTSIKCPKQLAHIIIESDIYKHYGYRSVSEFVLASARHRIEVYESSD